MTPHPPATATAPTAPAARAVTHREVLERAIAACEADLERFTRRRALAEAESARQNGTAKATRRSRRLTSHVGGGKSAALAELRAGLDRHLAGLARWDELLAERGEQARA